MTTKRTPASENPRNHGLSEAGDDSRGRTRTYDKPVNSRLLYQLSYAGMTDGKT
jgi:hypothetical protein